MKPNDPRTANSEAQKLTYRKPTLQVFGHFNAVTLGGANAVNGDGGGRNTKT
ncbi:MAG: lasso RiPP family leader peptide-containing protein [Terriglobales bacterium]